MKLEAINQSSISYRDNNLPDDKILTRFRIVSNKIQPPDTLEK